MDVVIFPDIEQLLVNHLSVALPQRGYNITVHTQIPGTRPESFVTVPRVGGPRRNQVVDSATISVDSWAIRPKPAHDLAQMVRGLIGALPGQMLDGYPIYRVTEFTGPGNMPDPRSQHARYTQAFSILVRGYAAAE